MNKKELIVLGILIFGLYNITAGDFATYFGDLAADMDDSFLDAAGLEAFNGTFFEELSSAKFETTAAVAQSSVSAKTRIEKENRFLSKEKGDALLDEIFDVEVKAGPAVAQSAPSAEPQKKKRNKGACKMRVKGWKCPKCTTTFLCVSKLARHVLIHTGENPFVCAHCLANFSQKSACIGHIKRHVKKEDITEAESKRMLSELSEGPTPKRDAIMAGLKKR